MIRVLTFFTFSALLAVTGVSSSVRSNAGRDIANSLPPAPIQLVLKDWPVTGSVTVT
jgi:hypothetical protein